LLWNIRSIVQGPPSNNTTYGLSMTGDDDGNMYVCGRNTCYYTGNTQVFENADGSTTGLSAGTYYVAKINNAGICKWIQGNNYSYLGWGYEINKLGNEISVVGWSGNNASTPQTSSFTSANNTPITLTISRADYFIAVYDTLGNLLRITKNGNNANLVDTYSFAGMFRESDGSYFIARNFRFFIGAANYDNFGTNVVATNGVDGTITKYSGSCGITYYPNGQVTQIDESKTKETLIIYPNPNNGIFTIQSDIASDYMIHDMLGKIVNEGTIRKGENPVFIQSNESGMYILKIKSRNSVIKLIKN